MKQQKVKIWVFFLFSIIYPTIPSSLRGEPSLSLVLIPNLHLEKDILWSSNFQSYKFQVQHVSSSWHHCVPPGNSFLSSPQVSQFPFGISPDLPLDFPKDSARQIYHIQLIFIVDPLASSSISERHCFTPAPHPPRMHCLQDLSLEAITKEQTSCHLSSNAP